MKGSYGRADFRIQQFAAGSVELRGVHALPALGPTLRFDLGIRMLDLAAKEQWGGDRPEVRSYQLIDMRGEVFVSGGTLLVGALDWSGDRSRIVSADYEHESRVALTLCLDYARLDGLEEIRKGGPLQVVLRLWPKLGQGASGAEAIEDLQATIPREDWAVVLRALRDQETEVIEITFHAAYAERFRAALKELKGAQAYIDLGDYSAAIVRCRKALEMVAAATRAEVPESTAVADVLAATVGPQRARAYAEALKVVKDLGNIELHEVVEHGYGRTEALFAVRTSLSLLQLYGALLSDRRTRADSGQ